MSANKFKWQPLSLAVIRGDRECMKKPIDARATGSEGKFIFSSIFLLE